MSEARIYVRDQKVHLSIFLRQVKQGQTVIITVHCRPVGHLSLVD